MDISKELAIGIDIGGTNTKYGIVNHRGEILKKGEEYDVMFAFVHQYVELHDATSIGTLTIKTGNSIETLKGNHQFIY